MTAPATFSAASMQEARGKAEMVGDRSGHQPPEEIAGDVAGDVGGRCRGGVRGAAALAEIGERQRESRRHEEPLRDAERGEVVRSGAIASSDVGIESSARLKSTPSGGRSCG